jgi:hypothetical protein
MRGIYTNARDQLLADGAKVACRALFFDEI